MIKKNKKMTVIKTLEHPAKRHGVSIPEELFDNLTDYIMDRVRKRQSVTLPDLIENAEQSFSQYSNVYISWCLYNVKLHLESKGVIKNVHHRGTHKATISLTANGRRLTVEESHKL